MNKKLLYEDTRHFNEYTEAAEKAASKFNEVLKSLHKAASEIKAENAVELAELISDPEKFVTRKIETQIASEPVKVFGLKISTKKAVGLIDLPDLSEVKSKAAAAKALVRYCKAMTLKGNTCKLNEQYLLNLKTSSSLFATKPTGIALANSLEAAAEALSKYNALVQSLGDQGIDPRSQVNQLFDIDTKGKLTVNPNYYRARMALYADLE